MERGVNDGIVRDEIRIADAQVNDVIVAGQCLGIKAQTGVMLRKRFAMKSEVVFIGLLLSPGESRWNRWE